jgi:acyl-CoA thioesterase I
VNPVLLYFAAGESLYPGVVLLVMAILVSRYPTEGWLAYLRIGATWAGLAMVVMACPPFAWSVDALFLLVFVMWLAAGGGYRSTLRAKLHTLTSIGLVALLFTFLVIEYMHRRMPRLHGSSADLVVIGDSISAGIGDSVRPWPAILQRMTSADIKNFSRAGADMADGLSMADRVKPDDHLVLIELGGNDLIARQSSKNFAIDLERVLAKLAMPGRTIVMFELPLIPSAIGYGQAQRRLSEEYGVALIPKRFLAGALSGRGTTSDGLHLTDIGATRMAEMVARIFSPTLKTQQESP